MALSHEEITTFHDKAYTYSETTRRDGSDDLLFHWLDQWDGGSLEESQLTYKGQFDILRKATRSILADLSANPVQVDFEPKDESRDDAADTMDGIYRAGNNDNASLEARANARQEMVVCGMGAWELYTEYDSMRSESNNNQVIKRRPIPEANNTAFCDPNAKLLDKSDANYWSILTAYTEDGYKDLIEEITGERPEEINYSSFGYPEQSYAFQWYRTGTLPTIYVSTFYHREIVKTKIITFLNPVGEEIQLPESDILDVMDDMIKEGFEIISDKTVNKWQVTKYIVSGEEILNGEFGKDDEREGEIVAGEHIPIVVAYGERAIVEGEEHWEGVTRLAKDPQRLRNFQLSYLADIVSRSPRQKPIFTQEQVAGHENMYEISGADNNYPFLLQNSHGEDGQRLPIGPVGVLPEQPIPTALVASIQLSREAVEDVANPGTPSGNNNPQIAHETAVLLQSKIDQQGLIYREHMEFSERRDGEIYASMASEVHDVPRTVSTVLPDGTRKKLKMMDQVIDEETGEFVTLNDINNTEFEVYSKIGPSYNSQKEQTLERIEQLLQGINPADPKYDMLLLQYLSLMDGTDFDDTRAWVRKDQIMKGYRKPDTDEEKQMLAEAENQQKEPSAEMLVGMGERDKGQAALLEQKRKGIEMQLVAQDKNTGKEIDGFNAQTKRMETQIKALIADVKMNMDKIDTFGKQIDNEAKLKDLVMPVGELTDDDLMKELMT